MRGKVAVCSLRQSPCRITPAYAGKRVIIQAGVMLPQDHPRVCGEKAYSKVIAGSLWGSPPRMRGKVCVASHKAGNTGITPAYAGKSYNAKVNGAGNRDHPRVCGEKRRVPAAITARRGITPAYAGKSAFAPQRAGAYGDHPRVCGEKSFKTSTSCGYKGSPPRMRGKAPFLILLTRNIRITPAYAGKSFSRQASR